MFSLSPALPNLITRKSETHYLSHLRDMLHNLPHQLFQNRLDAEFMHDFFCCIPYNSAYKWYQEVIGCRGGKASLLHFIGLPVGDGRLLSVNDIDILSDFYQRSSQLRQEHLNGKLSDKKFSQVSAALREQFNQCLLKLVQAQLFKVCRPTKEMEFLPDYSMDRSDVKELVFSRLVFWRGGAILPWLKPLSKALKPVPFHLRLPTMETYYLFLFFSVLDRLEQRTFVKKTVSKSFDIETLSNKYVGKYAGLAECDKVTDEDIRNVMLGKGNALAKVAKAILFNNSACYQKRK